MSFSAFLHPTPAFQPLIPPGVGETKPADSPSLRVSIGLNTLQTPAPHDHGSLKHHRKSHPSLNTLSPPTTHSNDPLKHHRKSHHHHHHHRHHTTSANTTPGLDTTDKPTVPPLRISLHDSSARLAASSVAELQTGLTELVVSIPISSLPRTEEKEAVQEREGERADRHRKKKRKKHKEKRRHEQEARAGGKGVVPGEGGEKRVHFGLEGERQSYGGKGLVQRSSMAGDEEGGGGVGEIGTQQFYKHERHHQSHREHPLSLSLTSQSYLSQSRTSQPLSSQAHSQMLPHTSRSSQPHSSQTHSHTPSHSSQSHSHSSHPSHPHSSQLLENKYSDKYYQHKKRMMEELSQPPPHTLTSSPSPTPLSPTSVSCPHTLPPITTSLITSEPHKHHKKKKKKRHKHSHSHLQHLDRSLEHSLVERKQLDDSVPTTPTSDLSTSVDIDLRPPSPLPVKKTTVLPERGKGARGGKGEREVPPTKKIQHTDYRQEEDDSVDQSHNWSVQTTSLPSRHTGKPSSISPLVSSPSYTEEGGCTVGSVSPVKRRHSSQKHGSGKQLRLQEVTPNEEHVDGRGGRGEDRWRGKGGGKRDYTLADYDPPPMALEQPELPTPSPQHPQGNLHPLCPGLERCP